MTPDDNRHGWMKWNSMNDLLTTTQDEMLTASRNTCWIFQKVVCHYLGMLVYYWRWRYLISVLMISSCLHVPDLNLLNTLQCTYDLELHRTKANNLKI